MAAIAGAGAAEKYGLRVLAKEIQDGSENVTRFIVAGRQTPKSHRQRQDIAGDLLAA